MKVGIGQMVVVALLILGIAAMLTGHDGELLTRIVDYLTGIAVGAGVSVVEQRVEVRRGTS